MSKADAGLAWLLRRDRIVVSTALIVLTVFAWAYIAWLYADMAMPAAVDAPSPAGAASGMAGMDMGPTAPPAGEPGTMTTILVPAFKPWAPADFAFVFAMWAIMMVGMMTPSVAPMVLLYAGVGRKAAESGAPFAPTSWFFAGYLGAWITFSVFATIAQWTLASLALLTPMMETTSKALGGVVLMAVALYQWTPLKDTCLRACQNPIGFLMSHGGFQAEPLASARLGWSHGIYCLGCCLPLMLLLFVGGVMNVLWIAGLTILILLEKVIPTGRLIPRLSGTAIGLAGVWLLSQALL